MSELLLELKSLPTTRSRFSADQVEGAPNFVRKASMSTTNQSPERSWRACALERTDGKLLAIKLLEDPSDEFSEGAGTHLGKSGRIFEQSQTRIGN